jgi:hypothetical protein
VVTNKLTLIEAAEARVAMERRLAKCIVKVELVR